MGRYVALLFRGTLESERERGTKLREGLLCDVEPWDLTDVPGVETSCRSNVVDEYTDPLDAVSGPGENMEPFTVKSRLCLFCFHASALPCDSELASMDNPA